MNRVTKIEINTDSQTLIYELNGEQRMLKLDSDEAMLLLPHLWYQLGFQRYGYTWLGEAVPYPFDDMIRIQELVYASKPDVIIETACRKKGSLLFYASLLKVMNNGRVLSIGD